LMPKGEKSPICFHLLWSEHKPLSRRLFAHLCSI
jgi:hypothetical protein